MPQSSAVPEGCDAIITPEEEHLYSPEDKAELEELATLMSSPAEPLGEEINPLWFSEQLDRIEAKATKALILSTKLLGRVNVLLEQVNAISGAESEDG